MYIGAQNWVTTKNQIVLILIEVQIKQLIAIHSIHIIHFTES